MEYIEKQIASRIIEKLDKVYPRTELEKIKMKYGLEVFLDNAIKLVCMIILAFLAGFPREAILVITACSFLRLSAGGVHADKSLVCMLITAAVTLGGGYLAWRVTIPLSAVLVLLGISAGIALLYAPSGTKNNPINPKFYKILKIRSVGTICLYAVLSVIFAKDKAGTMLVIGTLCEVFSILPAINRKYREDSF